MTPRLAALLLSAAALLAGEDASGLIERLGSASFDEREAAQRDLTRLGWKVRDELRAALASSKDLEVKGRLEQILAPMLEPEAYVKKRYPGHARPVRVGGGGDDPLAILGRIELHVAGVPESRDVCRNPKRALLAVDRSTGGPVVTDLADEEAIVALVRRLAPPARCEADARRVLASALVLLRLKHKQAHSDALLPPGPSEVPADWLKAQAWTVAPGGEEGGWRVESVVLGFGHHVRAVWTLAVDKEGRLSEIRLVEAGKLCN